MNGLDDIRNLNPYISGIASDSLVASRVLYDEKI